MTKKWISVWLIYVAGLASLLYALMIAPKDSAQMWIADGVSLVCVIIYLIGRIRYSKGKL